MNRDGTPTGAVITMHTTELLVTARQTWHKLSANNGLACQEQPDSIYDPGHDEDSILTEATLAEAEAASSAAVDGMAAALRPLWPSIPPESARDALCSAARAAVVGGIVKVPMRDPDFVASTMLELTAELLAADPGHQVTGEPIGPPMNPALTFASSCAFDRDEDAETLRSLAVLCVLEEMAGKPAPVEYDVPEELTADTGLTSWPERGSELAPLAVMAWEHAKRRVTMTYEQQDAVWRVTELDGRSDPPRTVSSELFERAAIAYSAALDIIVSPLP